MESSSNGDSPLEKQIKEQVEYYFGDGNYVRDVWMNAEAAKRPDKFISLMEVNKFSKMKTLKVTLEQVQNALASSDVVELNEDKTMIRRKYPAPEYSVLMARSCYVIGIPSPKCNIDALKNFFAAFGVVNSVYAVSTNGTCKLEMQKQEDRDRLIESSKNLQIRIDGRAIKIRPITEAKPKSDTRRNDYKRKRDVPKIITNTIDETNVDDAKDVSDPDDYPKGTIVKMTVPRGATAEDAEALVTSYGKIMYAGKMSVKTMDNIFVRFENPESAAIAIKDMTEKKQQRLIFGKTVDVQLLDGGEEAGYWRIVREKQERNGRVTVAKKAKTDDAKEKEGEDEKMKD